MRQSVARVLLVALAVGCGAAAFAAQPDAPPVARTVDVVDQSFGLTLPDPYRWMEGEKNAEFQAWLTAQGADTRKRLDALPGMTPWRQRLQKVGGGSVVNRSQRLGGERLFFIREKGKGTGTLMVRETDGRERLLLDPATLDDGKAAASITEYSPSPDGSKLAINIDRGGSEVTRVQVLDVATAKFMPDAVEPVWGEFEALWLPDGSGFTYTQIAPDTERSDGDRMQDMRVRLHTLGTAAGDDPVLLRAGKGNGANASFPLTSSEFPIINPGADSDWVLALAVGARPEGRACVARRDTALTAAARWRCLVSYDDAVQTGALHGDTLYLLSTRDRPNRRVLAIDLSRPDASLAQAREVLPMSKTDILTDLVAARDALYVLHMTDGVDGIVRIDYEDGKATPLALPFAGSVPWFVGDTHHHGIVFNLRGWTTPRSAYRYEPGDARPRDLRLGDTSAVRHDDLTSTETQATSADGTRVPLSIIHRKDIALDGRNRALLVSYGGYGISLQPRSNPIHLEWVKAGGVLAIAHVRGGGEKGDTWHRAGQGVNKYKGVEDFVASARALAKLGYSSRERTALYSMSMGGVLIGGALARHPDQFGAAIIDVGMLNPVRLQHSINGANQFAEVGDPRTEAGMKVLAAMDPYQNLEPGVAYPPVYLSVGLNDSRVSTWETGKFAAKLRTASTSGKPVWIRTDASAGHGLTSMDAEAAAFADIYTFVEAQLPGR